MGRRRPRKRTRITVTCIVLAEEGKEEGQGHLSVGVNQGVQKKINTNAKEIFRCAKERERAWGGVVGCS